MGAMWVRAAGRSADFPFMTRHITIIPELPSGETMPPLTMSVRMEGEGRGTNITSRIDIPYRIEGLYWFNVQFDGQVITRIPLEVCYSRMVTGPASPSP